MLHWADQFSICCLLDNHQYASAYTSVDYLLGAGAVKTFRHPKDLSQISSFQKNTGDWLLGHVSYDFKNHLEPLRSNHFDGIGFPDIFFFQPETIIRLSGNRAEIATLTGHPEIIYAAILLQDCTPSSRSASLEIQPRIDREAYLRIIQ